MHELPEDLPLPRHVLFRTRDVDEARALVARRFCDHRLQPEGLGRAFHARQHRVEGQLLSLNAIAYGDDVRIDPGELGSFYLVQVILEGGADVANGRVGVEADVFRGTVLNPDLSTRMLWRRGCAKLLVQIDAAALQQHAAEAHGVALARPLRFEPALDFSRPELAAWRRWLLGVARAIGAGEPVLAGAGGLALETRLLDGLLLHQPSTASALFARATEGRVLPKAVRRAEALIRERPEAALRLADLAAAAGATPRSLQLAFGRAVGMSPMRRLEEERLRRAYLDLSAEGAGVTEVAARWHFSNAGRFAQRFTRRFGESPSAVRRRWGHLR